MLAALVAVALLAGACSYVVGHAFVAPSHSFVRSRSGGFALAVCVLVAVVVPPTLADALASGGAGSWPGGLTLGGYRALWIALVVAGLLAGMRAWRMRPFGRGGRPFSLDESAASRAEAGLLLADSLADALDVLARERVSVRDVARLAPALRRLGLRFFHQVPERPSDAYALVARHLPPTLAAEVTGHLLEGAGKRG